ncbi:hypothetical protein VNI00_003609 [Paramarasmius palmivorus]|uniref:Uncharacterized protein n=1 Tax=Paramarasmius palmivorus TaxID=297713 RepID=A0AAW0DU11_9AGAR
MPNFIREPTPDFSQNFPTVSDDEKWIDPGDAITAEDLRARTKITNANLDRQFRRDMQKLEIQDAIRNHRKEQTSKEETFLAEQQAHRIAVDISPSIASPKKQAKKAGPSKPRLAKPGKANEKGKHISNPANSAQARESFALKPTPELTTAIPA